MAAAILLLEYGELQVHSRPMSTPFGANSFVALTGLLYVNSPCESCMAQSFFCSVMAIASIREIVWVTSSVLVPISLE